jgi:hypothetical protein
VNIKPVVGLNKALFEFFSTTENIWIMHSVNLEGKFVCAFFFDRQALKNLLKAIELRFNGLIVQEDYLYIHYNEGTIKFVLSDGSEAIFNQNELLIMANAVLRRE